MNEATVVPKKPLALALLVGICADALWAGLTESVVPFSFFPLIALGLAAYQLYQHYLQEPMLGNTPTCVLLSFFVGVFGQTALLKVQYPELGSNFFSLIATLLLLAAISVKLGFGVKKAVQETEKE